MVNVNIITSLSFIIEKFFNNCGRKVNIKIYSNIVRKAYDALTLKIQTDLLTKDLFYAGYFNAIV